MNKDERDLLEVLKFELEFVEKGGYGRSPKEAWRPLFIFEDSPSCMNYDCKDNPGPCSDCVLMQLVPPEFRSAKTPCRQIPLNEAGETLDTLYRYGDQREIEETLTKWLRATIEKLEERRRVSLRDGGEQPSRDVEVIKGLPLHQNLHPKCANPACPTAFHWLEGGKFFRFRPDETAEIPSASSADLHGGSHAVKHFWLCEHCSRIFTLVYQRETGVVLKLLCLELPLAEV
ncbi:MAG: hypothetical protein WBP79_15420, partial [Candidatus Acidiferrales bacterium]